MSNPVHDSRAFRDALGLFATGITVVTTRGADGEPVGLTVNSFNSVSLEPPLVLWSLSLGSSSAPPFRTASHYAIHVLSAAQVGLSKQFSGSREQRFKGLQTVEGLGGVPLLEGCLARFECRNDLQYAGGDHLIFVGRVERFERGAGEPLLYFGGAYRAIGAP
ncbi:flavin reductase family protein [Methyloversatilis thermotolerans]|uniref:flavin reductase family protein n=1 Tax=Methyloversatilis thermotolerans TaxID=1346290 RepID=UPI0003721A9E|nr:flavin reductase family protein [Methyloversatilis thermotolerans]